MASIYVNLWNKRKHLHKKRVQLLQDCFGIPIWPPWRHVKTPKRVFSQDVMSAILCGVTWQWNGGWDFGLQILSFLLFLENLHSCWARVWKGSIEYFHSCGQHLCKFIGTTGSVCIRKEFNSQRIVLGHQHGAVTSCENTLLNNAAVTEASLKLTPRIGRSSACPFKRRQHR